MADVVDDSTAAEPASATMGHANSANSAEIDDSQ